MNETETTRCPLWVKIVLVSSLALNLAIAGFVFGFVVRGDGHVRGGSAGLSYALPYIAALERDDRRAVSRAVRRSPDRPDRPQRRAQFEEMLNVLRADPLDRDAVLAVLKRQADGVAQVQAVAQAAWLERIEAMTAQERQTYADAVESVLRKGPRGRSGKNRKD